MNPTDELSGPALRLFESVESVTIVRGHIPSDPVMWHIKIAGKTLEINSDKMDTSTAFKKQYLKVFYRPPPAIKSSEWLSFVEAISEFQEVVTAKEESEHVYIAHQLMEKVRELTVVPDIEDAEHGMGFYEFKGHYCLISKKIDDIIEAHNWKASSQILSPVVAALGFKTEGNQRITCSDGKQRRFWWFYPEAITEAGESPTSSQKEIKGEVIECQ